MHVAFGNGNKHTISQIGNSFVSENLFLHDVLVIPHLTKYLLSISKITMDHLVDVLFYQPLFHI